MAQKPPSPGEAAIKEEMALKDLIMKIRSQLRYLTKKWKIILLLGIIGAVAGAAYAFFSKPQYVATCTFVLDEGKGGGKMSEFASLGLDLGNSSASLFSDVDNIIWLYSSRLMIQSALLTEVQREGKKDLLVNWFIEVSDLRKELDKSKDLKDVKFTPGMNADSLSIGQNAVLGWCTGLLTGKHLSVRQVDKTQNIVAVNVTTGDQLFSKAFNECLVKTVNDFYILTKTKKLSKEVELLQLKADSFQVKMNRSLYQTASVTDDVPYANPNRTVLRVAPQRKGIDVEVQSALYVEITKNLEASKLTLSKETPLIQVVDAPSLPLVTVKPPLVRWILIGSLGLILAEIVFLLVRNWYKSLMQVTK